MSSSAVAKADQETVEQNKKPSSKRKLLIVAIAVSLLALVGGAVWFSGVLRHHVSNPSQLQLASIIEKPTLIDVPDIITNLDNGSRRAIFVKLKARIEVAHASDQLAINSEMPRILDAFQTYLRSLRPDELHGGEGTYRLREALLNRINIISNPVQVLDVLFVEMLVQ